MAHELGDHNQVGSSANQVCLGTWAVVSSSRPPSSAMAAMTLLAARTDGRPPLVLRNRAGLVSAPGQAPRSVSHCSRSGRSLAWMATSRTLPRLP